MYHALISSSCLASPDRRNPAGVDDRTVVRARVQTARARRILSCGGMKRLSVTVARSAIACIISRSNM